MEGGTAARGVLHLRRARQLDLAHALEGSEVLEELGGDQLCHAPHFGLPCRPPRLQLVRAGRRVRRVVD